MVVVDGKRLKWFLSLYRYRRKINNDFHRKVFLAIIQITRTRQRQLTYLFYKLIKEVINLEENDRKSKSCRRFSRNKWWWSLHFRYHLISFCFSFFLIFFQVSLSLHSLFCLAWDKKCAFFLSFLGIFLQIM